MTVAHNIPSIFASDNKFELKPRKFLLLARRKFILELPYLHDDPDESVEDATPDHHGGFNLLEVVLFLTISATVIMGGVVFYQNAAASLIP